MDNHNYIPKINSLSLTSTRKKFRNIINNPFLNISFLLLVSFRKIVISRIIFRMTVFDYVKSTVDVYLNCLLLAFEHRKNLKLKSVQFFFS